MNRQEFATKVQDLVNQAYLHDIDNKYYKGLMDEAEKLRYPITLAEFLGWEVGIEYKDEKGFRYRLKEPNELQRYSEGSERWGCVVTEWTGYAIDKLQKAEKVEHQKQYRIPLPDLITTDGMQQYLTEKNGCWFASRLTEDLKQEWTEDELYNIPKFYRKHAKEMVK